ncbi:MAG: hypothetical protein ACRCXT_05265 [Paraclostridium sp.]
MDKKIEEVPTYHVYPISKDLVPASGLLAIGRTSSKEKGATIGIFSPSTPITCFCPKRFTRAKNYLNDKGFNIIERSFSLLKVNGVFDKISGIILGKHELFDDKKTGRKPYEVLLEVLDSKKIPFIAEFDCCHTHPIFTLPIGCEIELNATEKEVYIIKDWLR